MKRYFIRLVAFFLVPCLLLNSLPAFASTYPFSPYAGDPPYGRRARRTFGGGPLYRVGGIIFQGEALAPQPTVTQKIIPGAGGTAGLHDRSLVGAELTDNLETVKTVEQVTYRPFESKEEMIEDLPSSILKILKDHLTPDELMGAD